MASSDGFSVVLKALATRQAEAAERLSGRVKVGYAAPYAARVHEDLEAHHRAGQAKYLEQPARERRAEVAAAVREALQGGASMPEALVAGGEKLLELSRPLVPVLSGVLRESAFVEVLG